jgi:hypothetical protein
MNMKRAYICVLMALFVVAAGLSPAYAGCQCAMDKDTTQAESAMPCHDMTATDAADTSDEGCCCDGACSCACVVSAKLLDLPQVKHVTQAYHSMVAPITQLRLSSLIQEVPTSPPKTFS